MPENSETNKDLTEPRAFLYVAGFKRLEDKAEKYEQTLDSHEIARADSFVFPEHRFRYVLAHGFLREVLSQYVGLAPEVLTFAKTGKGKPYLTNIEANDWRFNLSHSDSCCAVAVTQAIEIGIDVEMLTMHKEVQELADRFYTVNEAYALAQREELARHEGFCTLWTYKEAVLKATGQGIANGLNAWEFELENPHGARLSAAPAGETTDQWSFFQCHLPEFQCLLAAAVPHPQVHWQRLD